MQLGLTAGPQFVVEINQKKYFQTDKYNSTQHLGNQTKTEIFGYFWIFLVPPGPDLASRWWLRPGGRVVLVVVHSFS